MTQIPTTYREAKKYLESFIPTPDQSKRVYQLVRMRRFCALLGNPQKKYPIIHVAGTSGKGSTATFAATILAELGLKTGLHLSPHLQYIGERMQINNQPISPHDLVVLLNEISPIVESLKRDGDPPTYFELLVALSFLYFAKQTIDAAVVEVGLGGTLDGTNVIDPSVGILTNISLDHTSVLGPTVTKIAREKMGIIKKGSPGIVSGFSQTILQRALKKRGREFGVPVYILGRDFAEQTTAPTLPGRFQVTNFSLAAKAVDLFVKQYFSKKINQLPRALKNAAKSSFIPGRLEVVQKKPLVVLDGAHNKAKMAALVSSLKTLYPKQKWLVILALKKDKSHKSVLRELEPITHQFVMTRFTQIQDNGRNLSFVPQELQNATKKQSLLESDSLKAVRLALDLSKQNDGLPILITGSLYLVGEVRNLWHAPHSADTKT